MLVLTRKEEDALRLFVKTEVTVGGVNYPVTVPIEVKVVAIRGASVRVGVEAEQGVVRVLRAELPEADQELRAAEEAAAAIAEAKATVATVPATDPATPP